MNRTPHPRNEPSPIQILATLLVLASGILGIGCQTTKGTGSKEPWQKWQVKRKADGFSASLFPIAVSGITHEPLFGPTLILVFTKNKGAPEERIWRVFSGISLPSTCHLGSVDIQKGKRLEVSFDGEPPRYVRWIVPPLGGILVPGKNQAANMEFFHTLEYHHTLHMQITCGSYDYLSAMFDLRGLQKALETAGIEQ